MKKVAAVVVTYNKIEKLKICISALRNQSRKPDIIIIINNGSGDGTKEYLDAETDLASVHQENTGGAGGFKRGLTEFLSTDADFAWLLDDDCIPLGDALKVLTEAEDFGICVKNSLALDESDQTRLAFTMPERIRVDPDSDYFFDYGTFFSGTLLPREIVEIAGLPNPDFFIWGDELEYYYRLKTIFNIQVITLKKSIVLHPAIESVYLSEWVVKDLWKIKYLVRNTKGFIHMRHPLIYRSKILSILFILREYLILLQIVLKQKNYKILKLWILIRGFFSKINGRIYW